MEIEQEVIRLRDKTHDNATELNTLKLKVNRFENHIPCDDLSNLLIEINGNGKPGLSQYVSDLNLAIYGDKKNRIKGMQEIQGQIFTMLVIVIVVVSLLACKELGVPFIVEVLKHFVG